MLKFNIW